MSKEQTAVGQAIQKLKDLGIYTTTLSGILEEAKEMEKEQIIQASKINLGWRYPLISKINDQAENYYNDTYGK